MQFIYILFAFHLQLLLTATLAHPCIFKVPWYLELEIANHLYIWAYNCQPVRTYKVSFRDYLFSNLMNFDFSVLGYILFGTFAAYVAVYLRITVTGFKMFRSSIPDEGI